MGFLHRALEDSLSDYGRADHSQGRGSSTPSTAYVRRLEDRVDRLVVISMAMWSILSEKANVSEDELMARVQALDLSDGKADGKLNLNVMDCPKCSRKLSVRHQRCLYCGAEMHGKSAFDTVL